MTFSSLTKYIDAIHWTKVILERYSEDDTQGTYLIDLDNIPTY